MPCRFAGRLHFGIHPFLFRLRQEDAAITLNWENDSCEWEGAKSGWHAVQLSILPCSLPHSCVRLAHCPMPVRWVQPSSMRELQPAVPLLADTLERLLLSDSQAAHCRRLAEDRAHGAAELAQWAVQALRDEAAQLVERAEASGSSEDERSGVVALDDLRSFGYHLAGTRPQMAPIANSVAAVLAKTHEELHARWAGGC